MALKQNPLPYLARFPEADVLTSSDQVVPTVTDDSLDLWQQGKVLLGLILFLKCCLFLSFKLLTQLLFWQDYHDLKGKYLN